LGKFSLGLEGHPSLKIAPIEESYEHNIKAILSESLNHEKKSLDLYKALLETVRRCQYLPRRIRSRYDRTRRITQSGNSQDAADFA
jgi:bacterioferritin (cytochrome b1)